MNQESGLSLMSITLDNSLHVHCQLCDRVKNLMIQINDTFDIESTKVGRSCKRLSLCRSSFYILLSSCLLVICYRRAKACLSWIWIHRYIYHLQLWRFYLETLKTDSSVSCSVPAYIYLLIMETWAKQCECNLNLSPQLHIKMSRCLCNRK